MKALPVVSRELRVAARKPATYWNRCIVALGAIVVSTMTLLILQRGAPGQSGFVLFVWMSIIAYIHCLLMGLTLTSDSLAEEKREGTLGLLFLTDLKGYDVVFGKLAAHSLRGVYGLISIFPILGLCLLLGGVTAAEFQRVMLVCVNNLFLSLSLGMLASAICREERAALLLGFIVLFALTAGFPALAWLGWEKHWNRDLAIALLAPSPGSSCFMAFAANYSAQRFWTAVIIQHLLAWLALGYACALVPRSWQDRARTAASEKRGAVLRQWIYGRAAMRTAFRRTLLDINPYHWLTSRDRFRQTLPWLWLVLAGIVWLIGLAFWPRAWKDDGLYVMTALILHSIFKVSIALEASRRLGADRRSGALELLLCAPLSVGALLRGQWLSLVRQFAVPAAVIVGVDILFFASGESGGHQSAWRNTWFCGVTVFVADMLALGWLGMWLGFVNRRSGQGGMSAVVQVCALPWLLFMGFVAFMALLDAWRVVRVGGRSDDSFLFTVWWLISMGVAALLGINAHRRLHRDLRSIAAERYVSRGAIWGRALGLAYGRWRAKR